MTIDFKKVLKAQEIIEETKKDIMLFVKHYFEDVALHEETWVITKLFNSKRKNFTVKIVVKELEDLYIEVNFQYHTETADWTYSIYCPELKIYDFEPPTKNELTIQGERLFRLKEKSTMIIGGEELSAMVYYMKEMRMREYLD